MKTIFSVLIFAGVLICTQSSVAAGLAGKTFAATTMSDDVTVRAAADDKSAVVTTLKKGTDVTASDRNGAYWKVKLADGKEGFVSVTSIKTKGSVKDLVKGAVAPAPAAGAPATPSAVDKAKAEADKVKADADKVKADAAAKAAAAKAAVMPAVPAAPAVPAKPAESNAKKLEKAAGGLFKK